MSDIGTIRKTVGRSLDTLSPFQRLERLRQNARPFIQQSKYNDKSSRVIVRKTVGPTRSRESGNACGARQD